MGQPWYIKKYGLEMVDVPLDTFYLSVEELEDYIVERTLAGGWDEHYNKGYCC